MTREEAKKYAENMTYREAIYNLKKAKSVPYRKATFIKVNELLKALEQEPFKPMVEIDLYSVIKQKYIEREVLDKVRAEIWDLQYGDEEKSMTDEDRADAYNNAIRQVIEIIDKYKSESEGNK